MADKPSQQKVYVEQTSKVIKLFMLLSALAAIAGGSMMVVGWQSVSGNGAQGGSGNLFGWGLLLLFGGLVAFIVLRVIRWWQHG